VFRRALEHRERDPDNQEAIAVGRYAVARALQALGRHDEAAAELELAIAWTELEEAPDGWYHEALAESSAALGRDDDARSNSRLALSLLPEADPSFEEDAERIARLRDLAGG
jgi:tetratricopeptide (TPR) repeat protein